MNQSAAVLIHPDAVDSSNAGEFGTRRSSTDTTHVLLEPHTAQSTRSTLRKGFTAGTAIPAQNDYLLRRNIQQASLQRNTHSNPEPFSSSDLIMQRVAPHQGLERVLSIYSNLSGLVRRVAGTLAITQKSR